MSRDIDYDNVWVCPGCQAIGSQPHAAWCPDWRIEQDREDEYMNSERFDDENDEPYNVETGRRT